MDDVVERAKALAHKAHASQVDKAGRPYIEHVARVAAAVSDDPECEAVAWAHDILEDCKHVEEEFWCNLPGVVTRNVHYLTRYAWQRADRYYDRIRQHPIALRVKLADIADNANEQRLALLDGATAARLRTKYAKALSALGVTRLTDLSRLEELARKAKESIATMCDDSSMPFKMTQVWNFEDEVKDPDVILALIERLRAAEERVAMAPKADLVAPSIFDTLTLRDAEPEILLLHGKRVAIVEVE